MAGKCSYTRYESNYLLGRKTLSVGQTDDLKIETTNANGVPLRYWVSRVGRDDGAEKDNLVTVECLIEGRWRQLATY